MHALRKTFNIIQGEKWSRSNRSETHMPAMSNRSGILRVAGAFGMEASGFWPRVNLKLISNRSELDRIDIQLKIYRGRGSRIPFIEGAFGFTFTGVAANIAAIDSGAIPERFKSDSVLQERFGIAGMRVSERFERDHFPLV